MNKFKLISVGNVLWADIEGYEGFYQVSTDGRVRSLDRVNDYGRQLKGKELKPSTDKKGYKVVILQKNGKTKSMKVHRLVAMAFTPNPENKPQINHFNGVKDDNYFTNLVWATNSENTKHAYDTGLKIPKKKDRKENKKNKLTPEQVEYIRKHYKPYCRENSAYALAKKFGVNEGTIRKAFNKETWKHVG